MYQHKIIIDKTYIAHLLKNVFSKMIHHLSKLCCISILDPKWQVTLLSWKLWITKICHFHQVAWLYDFSLHFLFSCNNFFDISSYTDLVTFAVTNNDKPPSCSSRNKRSSTCIYLTKWFFKTQTTEISMQLW